MQKLWPLSGSEPIREPGLEPRLWPSQKQPLAVTGMTMARGISRAVVSTAQWLGDQITDLTGLAALRVPLQQANGPRAVTLDLPGYLQTNSYGCGAVAAVMVVRHFRPNMEFGAVYDAVDPLPDMGADRHAFVHSSLWSPKGRQECSEAAPSEALEATFLNFHFPVIVFDPSSAS